MNLLMKEDLMKQKKMPSHKLIGLLRSRIIVFNDRKYL
jgi:hypothetical protein